MGSLGDSNLNIWLCLWGKDAGSIQTIFSLQIVLPPRNVPIRVGPITDAQLAPRMPVERILTAKRTRYQGIYRYGRTLYFSSYIVF